MSIIIENLVNQYKGQTKNLKFKKNKYAWITISLLIVLLIILAIHLVSFYKELRMKSFILLGVEIVLLIVIEIFSRKSDKVYFTDKDNLDIQKRSLDILNNIIVGCEIATFSTKEDLKELYEITNSVYESKFKYAEETQKAVQNIANIVLIPILLALAKYILDINCIDAVHKISIICLIVVFAAVILITVHYIFVVVVKDIIQMRNAKYEIFLDDLELLSKFDLK